MKFSAKLFAAIILSFCLSTVTTGHTSEPIKPLSEEFFSPIVITPVIVDQVELVVPTSKPKINQPEAKVKAIEKVVISHTTNDLSGNASWYCRNGQSHCARGYPDLVGVDAYAAAGPKLRAAIGENNWRGHTVFVNGVRVTLIDWCQCYKNAAHEKVIDLYYDIFNITGGTVKITW